MTWEVREGDCIDVMRQMDDASVDAVVTDPPYGLEFMGKEWDRLDGPAGAVIRDPATERGGFQDGAGGNPYSRSRIEYGRDPVKQQEWHHAWATEALRVLKPGGHLLAFGGTRTYHRLACAIEDAGFEIRDCLSWLYGSGFPKSLDVSKAIDKSDASAERRRRDLTFTAWMRSTGITAQQINAATDSNMGSHYLTDREQPAVATAPMFDRLRRLLPTVPDEIEALVRERTVESENWKRAELLRVDQRMNEPSGIVNVGQGDREAIAREVKAPHSPEAQQWQGWGTALKPAHEPIVVARKPLAGTVAANVLVHGVGAMNIDACRIGSDRANGHTPTGWDDGPSLCDSCAEDAAKTLSPTTPATRASTALSPVEPTPNGEGERPPSDTCRTATGCSDGPSPVEPGADPSVDTSSSIGASGSSTTGESSPTGTSSTTSTGTRPTTASRTCNSCGEPITSDITKRSAGRWPSNVCLSPEAAEMLDEQSGERRSAGEYAKGARGGANDFQGPASIPIDGLTAAQYGDSGGASRFFYCAKSSRAERNAGLEGFEAKESRGNYGDGIQDARPHTREGYEYRTTTQNVHPTVKPIELMRWLVRLVTPPEGLVLDPFAGSGTTGCAAVQEKFNFIGIEREAEYVEIARARIAHWEREQLREPISLWDEAA